MGMGCRWWLGGIRAGGSEEEAGKNGADEEKQKKGKEETWKCWQQKPCWLISMLLAPVIWSALRKNIPVSLYKAASV